MRFSPFLLTSVVTLMCAILTTHISAQDFVSPVDDNGHVVDFARDIAPILKNKCLKCHGPDDAKNDFRVDDSEALLDYVEPGDVESMLYVDYLAVDDEEMIMPPKSHGGPLSAQELALIRVWIAEGAQWPEGVQLTDEVVKAPPPAPQSLPARVWSFQGFFHPATVHFPVALFLFGAMFVVLGWKWPSIGTQIPLACLLFGAVTAVAASAMGWSFADEKGYAGWANVDMDDEFFWHRWGGVIVAVTSVILAVFALLSMKRAKSGLEADEARHKSLTRIWKVGLLVLAGMVGAVGHQGGELTYGADFYPKAIRILLGTNDEPQQAEVEEAKADTGPVAALKPNETPTSVSNE